MSKKKPIKLYQLYIAHEIRYASLNLSKLMGVAEHLVAEVMKEEGTKDGLPNGDWITIEETELDTVMNDTDAKYINVEWEVITNVKATIKE